MTRYGVPIAGLCVIIGVALAGRTYAEGNRTQDGQQRAQAPSGTVAPQNGTRVVVGRLESIDRANNLTIAGSEAAGLAFDKFKTDANTQVVSAGKNASVADLDEGQEVRASLGDNLHVQRIEILPSGTQRSTAATTNSRSNR